jgi:hypothetical protein
LYSLKTWLFFYKLFSSSKLNIYCSVYENRTRCCWINCKYRWRKFRYKLQQHTGRILI